MDAAGAGITPKEFWLLTPRELYAIASGVSQSRHDAERRIAWQTAMLTRAKRFPSWAAWFGGGPSVVRSAEELGDGRRDYEADRDRMSRPRSPD